MTIWKFPLRIIDVQVIQMPSGAKILAAANQSGVLCIWAKVNPANASELRTIEIVGTGIPVDDYQRQFIGTVVIEPFVWHVFELIRHGAVQ